MDQQPDGISNAQLFLDSIIENLPNMVFVKDANELRFVRMNKAGEDLLGIPREELLGKNDFDFFPQTEAEFFIKKDKEVLESRRLLDIPVEPIQTRDLGTRILHTKKIPLLDKNNVPQYLLGISEDVTERVEAEHQLQNARDAAEAASQAKNEFLARMSHELRTPLNAILGFAQLLQTSASQSEIESLDYIVKAGRHLLQLINEVLDVSRIETGRLAMSVEPVEVHAVISEAIDITRSLAQESHVSIEYTPDAKNSKLCVTADRGRLRQVLVNLIANGIKYNKPSGSVNVTVQQHSTRAVIAVTDTGPGIPPSHMDELFTPFSRFGTDQNAVEGTGLGLALSKTLVEAMNGTIDVENQQGNGTRFSVAMPLSSGSVEGIALDALDATSHGTHSGETLEAVVLYIEDNPSNVDLMRATCALWPGIELVVRINGTSGLEAVKETQPDLVLLDLHLPDISGDEVLRQIKAAPASSDIPVVILSANAMPDAMKESMHQGASAYITKPFDIDQLYRVIASLTRARHSKA